MNPLSFATLSSSPKGTPLRYAGNFTITTKSRPLGEGGIAAGDDGRGARPTARMFPQETSAAASAFGYDPSREKAILEKSADFPELRNKIIIPLKMVRASAETI